VELRRRQEALTRQRCVLAVEAINGEIFDALSDQAVEETSQIDRRIMIDLDGAPNKSG
jgi:enolase